LAENASGNIGGAAPGLRKLGYGVKFDKESSKKRNRLISLEKPTEERQEPSEPSEPSDAACHGAFQADGQPPQPSEQSSVRKVLNDKDSDGSDGSDGALQVEEEEAWTV
jgi:hypothetical protein